MWLILWQLYTRSEQDKEPEQEVVTEAAGAGAGASDESLVDGSKKVLSKCLFHLGQPIYIM